MVKLVVHGWLNGGSFEDLVVKNQWRLIQDYWVIDLDVNTSSLMVILVVSCRLIPLNYSSSIEGLFMVKGGRSMVICWSTYY